MLIRLLPEQASEHWDEIKVAINAALPPIAGMQSDRMSNILSGILTEDITVWISTEKREDANLITGIVLTNFTYDKPSGTKSLLLYCVYGYGQGRLESWSEGYETLRKFAKGQGCNRIIGYTDVESIKKYAASIGAETRYTLISFNLED